MSATFVVNQTLVAVNCAKCAVLFALPETWDKQFRTDHQNFFCPAGHHNYYPGETDEEKLRKQVAQLQTNLEHKEARICSLREQRAALERSRAALRGVHTRTCNRIKNGVCPCCHRTFSNLLGHMKTEHPDFKATE